EQQLQQAELALDKATAAHSAVEWLSVYAQRAGFAATAPLDDVLLHCLEAQARLERAQQDLERLRREEVHLRQQGFALEALKELVEDLAGDEEGPLAWTIERVQRMAQEVDESRRVLRRNAAEHRQSAEQALRRVPRLYGERVDRLDDL